MTVWVTVCNVCVFQCRPICTITRLGFHTRQTDGVECGLFFIHAPLGQTTLCVRRLRDDDNDDRKGEGETQCRLKACSSRKAPRGDTRLNDPIRRTNCYQQYYMPSQHIYCGRVWNLIQACDVKSSN